MSLIHSTELGSVRNDHVLHPKYHSGKKQNVERKHRGHGMFRDVHHHSLDVRRCLCAYVQPAWILFKAFGPHATWHPSADNGIYSQLLSCSALKRHTQIPITCTITTVQLTYGGTQKQRPEMIENTLLHIQYLIISCRINQINLKISFYKHFIHNSYFNSAKWG